MTYQHSVRFDVVQLHTRCVQEGLQSANLVKAEGQEDTLAPFFVTTNLAGNVHLCICFLRIHLEYSPSKASLVGKSRIYKSRLSNDGNTSRFKNLLTSTDFDTELLRQVNRPLHDHWRSCVSTTSDICHIDHRHQLFIWSGCPVSKCFAAVDVDFNLAEAGMLRDGHVV